MFGDNLKRYRKENKMSQVELAKKLNVANGTISMWENNLRIPDIATIKEIAKVFLIPMYYLIDDENQLINSQEETLNEKQKELFDIIKNLSNDDINKLIGYAFSLSNK